MRSASGAPHSCTGRPARDTRSPIRARASASRSAPAVNGNCARRPPRTASASSPGRAARKPRTVAVARSAAAVNGPSAAVCRPRRSSCSLAHARSASCRAAKRWPAAAPTATATGSLPASSASCRASSCRRAPQSHSWRNNVTRRRASVRAAAYPCSAATMGVKVPASSPLREATTAASERAASKAGPLQERASPHPWPPSRATTVWSTVVATSANWLAIRSISLTSPVGHAKALSRVLIRSPVGP